MPDFQYRAVDKDGKPAQGMMAAENKNHLAFLLQQNGLFLVSFKTEPQAIPEVPKSLPSEDATKQIDPEREAETNDVGNLTWKQRAVVVAAVAVCLLVGSYQLQMRHHSENTAVLLNEKIKQISPGMSREEVERIFTTSLPGANDPVKARYFVPPNFIVEVEYENAPGGEGKESKPILRTITRITRKQA